ncbi:histidine phosphatase superfamily [Nemania sp. NC0429]|nr:histidine phosphatase superfamily [Nemania sp. NC0429]
MAPIIDVVCQCESRQNVDGDNLHDPSLTDKGRAQAVSLRAAYPYMNKVKLIVSSPLRRAIQTARSAFQPVVLVQGMAAIVIPELQEASAIPCDVGSPPQVLLTEFGRDIDLFFFRDQWYTNVLEKYGTSQQSVAARASQARRMIRILSRDLGPDDHVVVVTHSELIKTLIEGEPTVGNGEFRSCQFDDMSGTDDEATLQEISPANGSS